ncbi:MAG: polysulfide reductase NrfD [Actinobacteria bacterium]|nr:polysulfide reductase NrfD [Actinomycetota bacterium]
MSQADDDRRVPRSSLTDTPSPAVATPADEPPPTAAARETESSAGDGAGRDSSPALGTHGAPAGWQRAEPAARVALQRGGWADAAWSFLFKDDTRYAGAPADRAAVGQANRRMRGGEMPPVHGPVINAPVWTWEVPLYFWFGGVAAGSSFIALACDLAGDHRSAAVARRVALGAVLPSPPLLIADLGRPARFLNMLRIFKPRSPMNLGAWSLVGFSGLAAAAVAADLLGRPRVARAIGGANAVAGGYLGSYTGVLLATTAVPLWARSRLLLGPIFVCTAAATGAAATRLALVAAGLPQGHPTRTALGTVETAAILSELTLTAFNERRLGRAAHSLEHGAPGRLFKIAKCSVRSGLALRLLRGPLGRRGHDVASVCYLGAGLALRYAWVGAGRTSASDDEVVARMARGAVTNDESLRRRPRPRLASSLRMPLGGGRARSGYAEAVRGASLLAERLLGRSGTVRGGEGTGRRER